MFLEELLKTIKERRSVREFTPEKIDDEAIRTLIDAAGHAPSNTNRQAWKFIILKNDKIKARIAIAVKKKIEKVKENIEDDALRDLFVNYTKYLLFFEQAPVVIFALYKTALPFVDHVYARAGLKTRDKRDHSELISVSMAVQNLLLTAHAMGLGACCMTSPLIAVAEIKKILDIRIPFEIAALIPIGKYEKEPEPVGRKKIDKIIEIVPPEL
ncbi:MAG: nitroreductase family protein [Candidatus Aminicenantes bacterium]|nr:nitroreductase family protein [Candidatus Aminicenantes bacterium]